MGKNDSKGSADLLALAMKRVFKEAVEKDIGALRKDMERGLKKLDQLRKEIAERFRQVLMEIRSIER